MVKKKDLIEDIEDRSNYDAEGRVKDALILMEKAMDMLEIAYTSLIRISFPRKEK
jgi:hypothetical protein